MQKHKKQDKPAWLKTSEEELKKIISDISQKCTQPAQIGLILRDQYGIPTTKLYGKKLEQYLKELGISNKEVENLQKKVEKINTHLKKNILDKKAKHKMQKANSRINCLKRYHTK